jgi:hypothetical protein
VAEEGLNGAGATRRALARVERARGIVLVEGLSDQIAVETLASRIGRDLDAEALAVVPTGGYGGMAALLLRFGPLGADLELAGLYDRGEEPVVLRALAEARVDRRGFHRCDADLEEELIRAVGVDGVLACLEAEGDLGSFRTLQRQPAWAGRPVEAQLRRYFGAGARRKLRYARALIEAVEIERIPAPLSAVLASIGSSR